MRNRQAISLIELLLALVVCTISASLAVPALQHGRRVLAVRSATAELAGLIALTRTAAIGSGGATLVLDLTAGTGVIESVDGVVMGDIHHLGSRHGVQLESDRTSPLRLRYDALGIGRLAGATIRVRKEDVRAALTVSAYGRVRW